MATQLYIFSIFVWLEYSLWYCYYLTLNEQALSSYI